jgi:predicted RecA/RadA family phage recombinase
MKNFVQHGDTLTLTPTAAVASGEAILVGKIFGVAVAAVLANTPGEFVTEGVFDLPALSTDTPTVGAVLYWDTANKRLTTTASGNTRVGVATAAKANGDTTARIKLDETVA